MGLGGGAGGGGGGGGQALGAAITSTAAAVGGKKKRRLTKEMWEGTMDFNERMSSTAWQRGVKDMRAAGINPIVSFMKGGASSPQGPPVPQLDNIGKDIGTAALQGVQMAAIGANTAKTITENKLLQRQMPIADAIARAYEVVGRPLLDAVTGTAKKVKTEYMKDRNEKTNFETVPNRNSGSNMKGRHSK